MSERRRGGSLTKGTITPSNSFKRNRPGIDSPAEADLPRSRSGILKRHLERLEGADHVKAMVRVRPFIPSEMETVRKHSLEPCIHIDGTRAAVVDQSGREREAFVFDQCFPPTPEVDQSSIYEAAGRPAVENALSGYNSCVFAYGQTCSGKTYTMLGEDSYTGLMPRVVSDLFASLEANGACNGAPDTSKRGEVFYEVWCSFMEIYRERVRDLLLGGDEYNELRVRNHPLTGPFVEGLTTVAASSEKELQRLIHRGSKERTTAATAMNDRSSRSHAVFEIKLKQTETYENRGALVVHTTTSRINLVDLAGSERLRAGGGVNQHTDETSSINLSLTTLRRVIDTLIENTKTGKKLLPPYRESMLTWLLSESLGGNSKTIMIGTVSPHPDHIEESLSTLRYTLKAKGIVNMVSRNEDKHLTLIRSLRSEVAALQAKLAEVQGGPPVSAELGDESLLKLDTSTSSTSQAVGRQVQTEGYGTMTFTVCVAEGDEELVREKLDDVADSFREYCCVAPSEITTQCRKGSDGSVIITTSLPGFESPDLAATHEAVLRQAGLHPVSLDWAFSPRYVPSASSSVQGQPTAFNQSPSLSPLAAQLPPQDHLSEQRQSRALQERVNTLQSTVSKMQLVETQQSETLEALTKEMEYLCGAIREKHEENERLVCRIDNLTLERTKLLQQLADLRDEKMEAESKERAATTEAMLCADDWKGYSARLDALRESLEEKIKVVGELEREKAELAAENRKLQAQLRGQEAEGHHQLGVEQRVAELVRERSEVDEQLAREKESRHRIGEERRKLRIDLDQLQKDHNTLLTALSRIGLVVVGSGSALQVMKRSEPRRPLTPPPRPHSPDVHRASLASNTPSSARGSQARSSSRPRPATPPPPSTLPKAARRWEYRTTPSPTGRFQSPLPRAVPSIVLRSLFAEGAKGTRPSPRSKQPPQSPKKRVNLHSVTAVPTFIPFSRITTPRGRQRTETWHVNDCRPVSPRVVRKDRT